MKTKKTRPTAILAHDIKYKQLEYFINHGVDIRNDENLLRHLGYLKDCNYGRKKGIEELGYKVFFIDRPSYLIPETLRRVLPGVYVKLLKFVKLAPFIRQFDEFFHNLHIYFVVGRHKPQFIFFASRRISRWILSQCDKHGCDTIEYNGTPPRQVDWNKTIERDAKYIISCFDVTKLLDVDISDKFYVTHLGADNEMYGTPSFDSTHRPIDLSAIGTYNNQAFVIRSRILDKFLEKDLTSHLKIAIHGYDSLGEDTEFVNLKQRITRPVYGLDYINILKSSKMGIVIPSDDHIAAGNGMPQRIFQNAAAGCMQLVYNCDAVKDIFTADEEIVLFADVQELIEKVKYYLEHDKERIRIARNAYERFLREYTAQIQIQLLLKKIYKNKLTDC